MDHGVKFIRKNGRVIPIKVDGNKSTRANVQANAPALKAEVSKSGLGQAAHFGGLALSAGQALVRTAGLGALATMVGDKALDMYEGKARAAKEKYKATMATGAAIGAVGAGIYAKAAYRPIALRLAAPAYSLKGALKFGARQGLRTRLGALGAATAATGALFAGVGAYGNRQANKHLGLSQKLRGASDKIKAGEMPDLPALPKTIRLKF